ncbi:MAG: hypothetical protein EBU84_12725, partial [Actinobacteria bacterium]|nr:hypothetical protein [Actinomycetota bacterium]
KGGKTLCDEGGIRVPLIVAGPGIRPGSVSHTPVISYDLFREHGPEIIKNTGADTLIMDEVHRARATEGVTYNKLRELRPNFKNVITLTGSVVNNDPNEIVPLLDITYGPTGHKLVSTKFFDKLFVQKDAKTVGLFNPKTVVEKKLKNKSQLAKYLAGKVSYVPHEAVEDLLPSKNLEIVRVNMSPEQKRLYDFSLASVDPVTRWKIRNNLPVGQREAQEAFGKLMQARQVATDPSVLDKELEKHPDPTTYSPKVSRVVEDLKKHLDGAPENKSVIYGNLIQGQLNAVEKALKHHGIEYSTFFGVGNEGNSAKARVKNLTEFQNGKSRVLLISGAGAEGLDLKNANLLQMLEGHYNPERIHQAESRIRRMGSPLKDIRVKRYVSVPTEGKASGFIKGLLAKTPVGGNTGVDEWIYSIADKKSALNNEFKDVLDESGRLKKTATGLLWGSIPPENKAEADRIKAQLRDTQNSFLNENSMVQLHSQNIGRSLIGGPVSHFMRKKTDQAIEKKVKQALLDRGLENLTQKKHYNKILAESKFDEKAIDADMGISGITMGGGLLAAINPRSQKLTDKYVGQPLAKGLLKVMPTLKPGQTPGKLRSLLLSPIGRPLAAAAIAGLGVGAGESILGEYARRGVLHHSIDTNNKDLDKGIEIYKQKLLKKYHRKYKGSKDFVNEYETKQELGIDPID